MEIVSNLIEGVRALSSSMQTVLIFLVLVATLFLMGDQPKKTNRPKKAAKKKLKFKMFRKKQLCKTLRTIFKSLPACFICLAIVFSVCKLSNSLEAVANTIAETEMYVIDTESAYDFAETEVQNNIEQNKKATAEANQKTAEANADEARSDAEKAASDSLTAQAEAEKQKAASDTAAYEAEKAQAEAEKEKAKSDKAAYESKTAQVEASKSRKENEAKEAEQLELESSYWSLLCSAYKQKNEVSTNILELPEKIYTVNQYKTSLKRVEKECPKVYNLWVSYPMYRDQSNYKIVIKMIS